MSDVMNNLSNVVFLDQVLKMYLTSFNYPFLTLNIFKQLKCQFTP